MKYFPALLLAESVFYVIGNYFAMFIYEKCAPFSKIVSSDKYS